jgi:DNA-binding HxlR family transcriptional regulator
MATPTAAALSDGETRAGSRVLSLFESPLNTRVLRAHAGGPKRLTELQRLVGSSAQTTVRAAVAGLCAIGALSRQSVGGSSHTVTALTGAGEEMLFVAAEVETWLRRCPDGPIAPAGEEARDAVKALGGGWSSALVRVLANRPFTLTELDGLIPGISYSSLERRLSWMRTTGQIEPVEKAGRGTPYVVTDWLRYAIAPLCAAGRCERRHLEEAGPITAVEVEASFLLAVPLAPLRKSARGSCTLAVQTDPREPGDEEPELAGVTVEVERGRVVACAPEICAEPATWAVGTPETWLDIVIDGRVEDLRIGGANPQLALDPRHRNAFRPLRRSLTVATHPPRRKRPGAQKIASQNRNSLTNNEAYA